MIRPPKSSRAQTAQRSRLSSRSLRRHHATSAQPRTGPQRPQGPAYAADIVRLRARGYTYEAIREALADVVIHLSEAALRREVRSDWRSSPSSCACEVARSCAPPGVRRPALRRR